MFRAPTPFEIYHKTSGKGRHGNGAFPPTKKKISPLKCAQNFVLVLCWNMPQFRILCSTLHPFSKIWVGWKPWDQAPSSPTIHKANFDPEMYAMFCFHFVLKSAVNFEFCAPNLFERMVQWKLRTHPKTLYQCNFWKEHVRQVLCWRMQSIWGFVFYFFPRKREGVS